MTNGAEEKKRTQRDQQFTDSQRIWLIERDLDELISRIDHRLDSIDRRQWWVIATFIGMIITFASVLLSILGTR